MKLSSAQLKEIGKIEPDVEAHCRGLMDRYRTRQVRLEKHDPSYELYFAEGARYQFFYRGNQRGVQMQSEMSLHAGGGAMSHQVGKRTTVPQGTWVVEFELFLGKPFITIHHWGIPQIGGAS